MNTEERLSRLEQLVKLIATMILNRLAGNPDESESARIKSIVDSIG